MSPALRERFADACVALVNRYELDGIDIDWEHPSSHALGGAYYQLLLLLRAKLPRPRYILTSALLAGEWALQYIPLAESAAVLDLFNLMAYDFTGPWTARSGHHARLYSPRGDPKETSADAAVKYMQSRGVPSDKILLGIPAFGRSFLGASDVDQPYHGHGGQEGTFEFRDLPRPGATEHVDLVEGAAYCVGGDGGFVSYDNVQTVRMKGAYVRDRGLAGCFFWHGVGDLQGAGKEGLIETAFRALHSG